jgi:hypothetical protein
MKEGTDIIRGGRNPGDSRTEPSVSICFLVAFELLFIWIFEGANLGIVGARSGGRGEERSRGGIRGVEVNCLR